MNKQEAIWWVNHLFEIRKEEYFNKGMMKDAKEVEEAQHILKKIFYQIYDKGYEQGYKDAKDETTLTTGGHLYLANDNGELIDIGLCYDKESEGID